MPASFFSLLIDLNPARLSDRKIHGGLQRLGMAYILIFALYLDNFERPTFQKSQDEWTFDLQPRRAA
jgi:hypothetical protein